MEKVNKPELAVIKKVLEDFPEGALHEGNFARYYVSPSEFKRWKEAWG